jgi:hypothetical protein
MVRNYKRKRTEAFNPQVLKQAVDAVNTGRMNLSEAAREFNLNRNTIRYNLDQSSMKASGGQTIFTNDQEENMCNRLIYVCQQGFPLKIADFLKIAYTYGSRLERRKLLQCSKLPKSWHDNEMASYDWWLSFKKRFPNLTLRVAEGLSNARAQAFNEERVKAFFEDYVNMIMNLNLQNHPALIYNCDETGLSSVPSTSGKVIAPKGVRSVQQVTVGERGTLTTLLPCVNATGEFLPPFLIFKGATPGIENYPEKTKIFRTKSGYIDHDTFFEFLKHFEEHRIKINGKKVALVLDGHTAHLSIAAIEFAISNDIELICLPPHCTHRLQPLDTHVNKVLKTLWCDELRHHLMRHDQVILTRYEFHSVFKPVWMDLQKRRGLVVDAFYHCGLYPPRNPTLSQEFHLAENYSVNDHSVESTHASLHAILPSPKKKAQAAHKRPHTAHITSPENVKNKIMITKLYKSDQPSTSSGIHHPPPVPHERKSASTCSIIPRTKEKRKTLTVCGDNQASTSSEIQYPLPFIHAKKGRARGSIPMENIVEKRRKKNMVCCVCHAPWSTAVEDWMRCDECGEWACETCFLTNTCLNC